MARGDGLKLAGKVSLFMTLFLSFGYPIQASIPIVLGVPSTPINLAFRAMFSFASIFFLAALFSKDKKVSTAAVWIFFFWVLYTVRLVYDLNIRGIEFSGKSSFYIYSMAYGGVVLPFLSCILTANFIERDRILPLLFKIIVVSNLLIFLLILFQNGGVSLDLFAKRISVYGRDSTELVINTITIGLYGNALFQLSVFLILFRKCKTFSRKVFTMVAALIGLLNVLLAASRGPFLSLVLVLAVLLYTRYRFSLSKAVFFMKYLILSMILFSFFLASGLSTLVFGSFQLFSRLLAFQSSIERGVMEVRDYEYQSAWEQFLSSPLWGDQFVTRYDSYYPHNIYLEVLMSLGVVGFIVLMIIHFVVFRKAYLCFRLRDTALLPVFFMLLVVYLGSITSGGIAYNPALWLLITLFLCVKVHRYDQKVLRSDSRFVD